jgi:signal transduction histidine kinase
MSNTQKYLTFAELCEQAKLEDVQRIVSATAVKIVLPLFLLIWIFDFFYIPQYKWESLLLHSLVIPIALFTQYTVSKSTDIRLSYYVTLFYVFSLAAVTNIIIYIVGEPASPYYAALNIIAFGALALIPWPRLMFGAVTLAIFAPYFAIQLKLLKTDGLSLAGMALPAFTIVATLLVAGIVRYFHENMRKREIQNKYNLQQEINRRQDLEKEILPDQDNSHTANVSKTRFLANMSHELRTPLHAIIGYSQLIQENSNDKNNEQNREDAEKIEKTGRHLLSIVNNILEIVKLEDDRLDANIDIFHVNEVVDAVEQIVTPMAKANNNKLVFDCPDTTGVMESDVNKVKQILLNVIENACKFTQNGTISLSTDDIEIENKGWIKFIVKDDGIGMPPLHTKRIFDAFEQVDNSPTREYQGPGLGLAISKQFSRFLGGDITVQSVVGEGTTFTIYLPRTIKQNSDYEVNLRRVNHRRSKSAYVYVLEDDEVLRNKIQVLMINKGFDVNGSGCTITGLETSKYSVPDVIIRTPELRDNELKYLFDLYQDYSYATTPVMLEFIRPPYQQGNIICYHEYFPNISFASLINLYEHMQQKGLLLVADDIPVVSSLKVVHSVDDTMKHIDNLQPKVILIDQTHIEKEPGDKLSELFNAIYKYKIRVVVTNPRDADYSSFVAVMSALSSIVKNMNPLDSKVMSAIIDGVIRFVRKDLSEHRKSIRSLHREG